MCARQLALPAAGCCAACVPAAGMPSCWSLWTFAQATGAWKTSCMLLPLERTCWCILCIVQCHTICCSRQTQGGTSAWSECWRALSLPKLCGLLACPVAMRSPVGSFFLAQLRASSMSLMVACNSCQALLVPGVDAAVYLCTCCRVLDVGCGCGFIAACAAVLVSSSSIGA